MNTALLEATSAAAAKSQMKLETKANTATIKAKAVKAKPNGAPARGTTSATPKKQLPKEVKAAAEAFAKDVAKKAPAKQAVKKLEKAAAPKAKKEPKVRPVSAMQVIRRTLAHNHNATVEEISKACTEAGVPKADATIQTIRSDFMQTYAALLEAGRIKTS